MNDNFRRFYIDGRWTDPQDGVAVPVVNPASEEVIASIHDAGPAEADTAVAAASRAFDSYGRTSREERLRLMRALLDAFEAREEEIARSITAEMGAPIRYARAVHTKLLGTARIRETIAVLETFEDEMVTPRSGTHVYREPVGVCALITPWNFPINQIMQKVLPALATGCTVVLKASALAPLDAVLFAECIEAAGFPPGVFNLIQGSGAAVGQFLASHPKVDMVSLTGSQRAGSAVMQAAAPTVKRVALELGGKSPNIVFADADLDRAAQWGVQAVMRNSGQTCSAPIRMLVERAVYTEMVDRVAAAAASVQVGDPAADGDHIGPVVSAAQFDRVQGFIATGVAEGARLVAGGQGRPQATNRGWFVRPTVFADVDNAMTIAREEIFGPVLSVIPFDSEAQAIAIANDTPYGLAGHIFTADQPKAARVGRRLRAGSIGVNGASPGLDAPFGGVKASGIGREGGVWGFEDYTEPKALAI